MLVERAKHVSSKYIKCCLFRICVERYHIDYLLKFVYTVALPGLVKPSTLTDVHEQSGPPGKGLSTSLCGGRRVIVLPCLRLLTLGTHSEYFCSVIPVDETTRSIQRPCICCWNRELRSFPYHNLSSIFLLLTLYIYNLCGSDVIHIITPLSSIGRHIHVEAGPPVVVTALLIETSHFISRSGIRSIFSFFTVYVTEFAESYLWDQTGDTILL